MLWRVWTVLWWVYSAVDGLDSIVEGVWCCGGYG